MDQDDTSITHKKRSVAFWVVIVFMCLSVLLLLLGQTTAVFNYEFAVSLGLQENVKDITEFGVQLNRAFAAADTLVYIPLIVLSIAGLVMKKAWALFTTATVMGISLYWTATATFIFWFMQGVPYYSFVPGVEYWIFISSYMVFGMWGICYLIFRGESLIR